MNRKDLPKILFEKINCIEPYPDYVTPASMMINKTAFFPGGKGLWLENESNIFPSILVLGQDFSTFEAYKKMLDNDSNVFMGLRKTKSMVGKFPGFKDREFVKRNLDFLEFQIETIKPKLIITLGLFASKMLGSLSPNDLLSWKTSKTFKGIDDDIKIDVNFRIHQCTCVAIVHPSMRYVNVRERQYKNYTGDDAEIRMLKDALHT